MTLDNQIFEETTSCSEDSLIMTFGTTRPHLRLEGIDARNGRAEVTLIKQSSTSLN